MSSGRFDRDWEYGRDFGRHFDPGNFSFARSFRRHGGMKYYVLWLLSQKPLRGSEIIEEVQKQTMGWWRPSPGTVYPLLNSMDKDGLIRRKEDMRYELTDAGAETIGLKSTEETGDREGGCRETWNVEKILTEMEGYTSYLEEEHDKLEEYSGRIGEIVSRLSRLKKE